MNMRAQIPVNLKECSRRCKTHNSSCVHVCMYINIGAIPKFRAPILLPDRRSAQ